MLKLNLISFIGFLHLVAVLSLPLNNTKCKDKFGSVLDELEQAINTTKIVNEVWGFPSCLDKTMSVMHDFRSAFTKIETFDRITSSVIQEIGARSKISLELSRITVPDATLYNLRNWLHIKIEALGNFEIEKLFLIAMSSPLGLPFGEFRPDIRCKDDPASGIPPVQFAKAVPCKYRSKASVRHPNAFVLFPQTRKGYTTVHTNFNWIDAMCSEVTAIQFAIVANMLPRGYTNAISEAVFRYSPVFSVKKRDSGGGNPYPWYNGWKDSTYCHSAAPCHSSTVCRGQSPQRDENLYLEPLSHYRIHFNKEYDDCMKTGAGLDPVTKECPPGPFYCSESRAQAAKDNAKKISQFPHISLETTDAAYKVAMTEGWAACPYSKKGEHGSCPVYLQSYLQEKCDEMFPRPEATEGSTTVARRSAGAKTFDSIPQSSTDKKSLELLVQVQQKIDRCEHGAFMIAAFFLVISCSNFMARFFKETGGNSEQSENGCCGIRLWLWAHIVLSFVSIGLIWISLLMPTMDIMHCPDYSQNNTESVKCFNNPTRNVLIHKYTGYTIVGIVHIDFLFGWIRPLNTKLRSIITAVHSICGHVLQFLAFVAVVVTKLLSDCSQIFYLVSCLFILSLVMSGVAAGLQCMSDRGSLEGRKRKIFPIVEQIEDRNCKLGLILQIFWFCASHLAIYGLIVYVYHKILSTNGKCEKDWWK